jgi:hypothetical protein
MPTHATADIEDALARLDASALAAEYRMKDELVVIPEFLRAAALLPLLEDVRRLSSEVHRSYLPRHKKSGSVSHFAIADRGPALLACYRSDALRRFLARLVGTELLLCPDDDPHACALYFYTEPGDHMGYHYDTSYYRGARYTVLLGLVQDSESRLLCRLHTRSVSGAPRDLAVSTTPGALVVMNGDKVLHAVSPSRAGERRVVFSMEYVTSREMGRVQRVVSNWKDAVAYFGLRSLWHRRARARRRATA